MANLKITLVVYVKKENGWTRYPPVRGANGRIRPGYALVDGAPRKFETYTYQLRSYEGRRAVFQTIGTDAANASAQQVVREKNRLLRHEAKSAGVAVIDDDQRRTIATAVKQYIERATKRQSLVAAEVYRASLTFFQESAARLTYVDQVDEATLLEFHAYLRKRGNSERTIANRHGHVKSLLLWCGMRREDAEKEIGVPPKFEKKKVVPYTRDELSTLFAAAEDDRYFWTVLRLLQMSGLREAEATHLMWADIDFKRKQIHVRSKPEMGFQIKDREERIIPLPEELAGILHERRTACPASRLVVGTAADKPHTKWLRMLKRVAIDAGLNCGHCKTCRAQRGDGGWDTDGGCQRWTLHNFRRTYATALDEAGFSLKQIMDLLGHSDVETTMRYLGNRALESNQTRMQKVTW